MTLSVHAGYQDTSGQDHDLPLVSNLAGFESARSTFYGSAFVRQSGAKLLPLLEVQAVLRVDGAHLAQIRGEVVALLASIHEHQDPEYWSVRLRNILAAVEAAEAHDDDGWVEIA